MRLDKWLQIAQIFKTRSQATRACSLGRVRVNGVRAKPHRLLSLEDRLEIEWGERRRILVVKGFSSRTLPKAEARALYEDHSPPPPPPDPLKRLLRLPPVRREKGLGRPTKKERRLLRRLKGEEGVEEP